MKKLLCTMIAALMLFATLAFTGCSDVTAYASTDATDLLQEDFGIALKKGDTVMKEAVDAVINEWKANGKMDEYHDYYNALSKNENPTAPEGLTVEWTFTGTEVVTMYTESGFAPYEFVYEGEIVGVDAAIMSQVAVNLGCKLEIKDVAFDTIIAMVNGDSGKAAGAAGLSITEERKQEVDFSAIYASSTLSIVSAESKTYNKLADLDGLKIGVQQGTSGDLIASKAITSEGYSYTFTDDNEQEQTVTIKINATVKQYNTYSAALADLKAGRIDVIFMDKVPAELLIANA